MPLCSCLYVSEGDKIFSEEKQTFFIKLLEQAAGRPAAHALIAV